MTDCKNLQEHYEAFALGALEGEERAELESHLERRCATCTPAVEEARSLAAELAWLADPVAPPSRVRRRLMAEVRGEKQEAARPSTWTHWVAWGAAAAALVFAFVAHRESTRLETQIAGLERQYDQLSTQNSEYRRVLTIISAPATRPVSLGAADSPQLHAYWNEPLGLVLAGSSLPAPGPDRTLQLWIVPAAGNPISVGIFRPDENGNVLSVFTPSFRIAGTAALAISDEPAGGSPQPTTTPAWVGSVG